MSVASLNNGQLQLSDLTISNEKYAGATGYVAAETLFSSTKNSVTMSADTIIVNSIDDISSINFVSGSDIVSLTCPDLLTLQVGLNDLPTGIVKCAEITLVNNPTTANTVGLTCPADNTLEVDGNITATGANSGSLTFDTPSLTIARNVSGGNDEYDLVCINQLSDTFLNIYGSQTSVVGVTVDPTTEPIVSVKTGALYATTFRQGIGMLSAGITIPPFFTIGASTSANFTIPEFVGSSNSAYIISFNNTSNLTDTGDAVYSGAILFVSADPVSKSTTVKVIVTYVNGLTAETTAGGLDFSIIAMN